jgi:hypothetical protein
MFWIVLILIVLLVVTPIRESILDFLQPERSEQRRKEKERQAIMSEISGLFNLTDWPGKGIFYADSSLLTADGPPIPKGRWCYKRSLSKDPRETSEVVPQFFKDRFHDVIEYTFYDGTVMIYLEYDEKFTTAYNIYDCVIYVNGELVAQAKRKYDDRGWFTDFELKCPPEMWIGKVRPLYESLTKAASFARQQYELKQRSEIAAKEAEVAANRPPEKL